MIPRAGGYQARPGAPRLRELRHPQENAEQENNSQENILLHSDEQPEYYV